MVLYLQHFHAALIEHLAKHLHHLRYICETSRFVLISLRLDILDTLTELLLRVFTVFKGILSLALRPSVFDLFHYFRANIVLDDNKFDIYVMCSCSEKCKGMKLDISGFALVCNLDNASFIKYSYLAGT